MGSIRNSDDTGPKGLRLSSGLPTFDMGSFAWCAWIKARDATGFHDETLLWIYDNVAEWLWCAVPAATGTLERTRPPAAAAH